MRNRVYVLLALFVLLPALVAGSYWLSQNQNTTESRSRASANVAMDQNIVNRVVGSQVTVNNKILANTSCGSPNSVLQMKTNKSYIGLQPGETADYILFFDVLTSNGTTFRQIPYEGKVDMYIRSFNTSTNTWQENYFSELLNLSGKGGRISIPVNSPNVVISEMYAKKSTDGAFNNRNCYGQKGDVSMVQVNVNSSMFLKELIDYWPLRENDMWRGMGINYPMNGTFNNKFGVKKPNYFHFFRNNSHNSWITMYHLKDDPIGYHGPNMPWGWLCYYKNTRTDQYNDCVNYGSMQVNVDQPIGNVLWGLKGLISLDGSDTNYLVANDGQAYDWVVCSNNFNLNTLPFIDPAYRSQFPNATCLNRAWDDVDFFFTPDLYQYNYATGADPTASNQYEQLDDQVNIFPSLRNYILAPEWIGDGWGVNINMAKGDAQGRHKRIWTAYADEIKETGEIRFKFREGSPEYLRCNASDCPSNMWGHREDWYFANYDGKAQMTRMRNRECGFKEALPEDITTSFANAPINRKRIKCYSDRDVRINHEVVNPHVEVIYNNGPRYINGITPTSKPNTPTQKPSTTPSPTSKPSTPTQRPATPTSKPNTPTQKPATPTQIPPSPTNKPNTPTQKPITSTQTPASPTSKPATPTPDENVGIGLFEKIQVYARNFASNTSNTIYGFADLLAQYIAEVGK